jgi:hypothetical protein
MEPTTGLILRRITQTELSVSAHKLATLILDGIAWKDGYNGLPRGTAAFTLAALAAKMGVSRQYLFVLLAELESSELRLERHKPNGKFAPWLFRFAGIGGEPDASGSGDTSLSMKEYHKTIFTGRITIDEGSPAFRHRWSALIQAAKAALPCWDIDPRHIWERFIAFNLSRGNTEVPAGYLLGFMRKWRTSARSVPTEAGQQGEPVSPEKGAFLALTNAAPLANRHFHAADLISKIGVQSYEGRVAAVIRQFGCQRFAATLAVHGQAVRTGEIGR